MKNEFETSFAEMSPEISSPAGSFDSDLTLGNIGGGVELVAAASTELSHIDDAALTEIFPIAEGQSLYQLPVLVSPEQDIIDIEAKTQEILPAFSKDEPEVVVLPERPYVMATEQIPLGYIVVAEGVEGKDCVMIDGVKYCREGELSPLGNLVGFSVPTSSETPSEQADALPSGTPLDIHEFSELTPLAVDTQLSQEIFTVPEPLLITNNPTLQIEAVEQLAISDMSGTGDAAPEA